MSLTPRDIIIIMRQYYVDQSWILNNLTSLELLYIYKGTGTFSL